MNQLKWVEIDKKNIAYNLKNIKSLLRMRTRLMVVVKANAYGHGLVEFAQEAVKNGADYLGVNSIEEALELRKANIIKPVLVLGYTPPEAIEQAALKNIEITVTDPQHAVDIVQAKFTSKIKVHLKVETGVNRLGTKKNNILNVYKELSRVKKTDIIGLYSHLASVEENDLSYTAEQFKEFGEIIDLLKKNNIDIPIKHIAASGAMFVFPESHFDMVRVGISAYGHWSSEENRKTFFDNTSPDTVRPFLKSCLSYKTKIVQIKEVTGGFVGYGCTHRVTKATRLAVIPVGYHEGYDRGFSCSSRKVTTTERSGCGEVLIAGVRCPVVGRVCMDMTIVDVSRINPRFLHVGDEVVIIGKQGEIEITAEEIAKKIDTINYEILARIPTDIPRFYK